MKALIFALFVVVAIGGETALDDSGQASAGPPDSDLARGGARFAARSRSGHGNVERGAADRQAGDQRDQRHPADDDGLCARREEHRRCSPRDPRRWV